MKFFRQVTTYGGIVIMGEKRGNRFQQKFRPLNNRINVIITSSPAEFMDNYNRDNNALKREIVLACTS
jgi:dihydrofolate reductase